MGRYTTMGGWPPTWCLTTCRGLGARLDHRPGHVARHGLWPCAAWGWLPISSWVQGLPVGKPCGKPLAAHGRTPCVAGLGIRRGLGAEPGLQPGPVVNTMLCTAGWVGVGRHSGLGTGPGTLSLVFNLEMFRLSYNTVEHILTKKDEIPK